MAGGDSGSISLKQTPTWALATVCFFMVSISIVLEHSIHLLTNWLKRHRKNALYDAVWRLKSELMLLGFMSLLLAVTQDTISKICVPSKAANMMFPCSKNVAAARNANATNSCSSKGKVPLMTEKGIQQLQIFIFVLAVTQIVYSVLTMALGRAKMKHWKQWEKETQTTEYQVANDPNRFRFARDTSFGRRHAACTETAIQLWIKCFFRQFFNSVAKVDYLTLRHGFINAHLSAQSHKFNFQKYIESSLDEDFKLVVSVSPLMWFLVVIFMLVDVHGWNSYLWISYVPLLIVLVLDTKLEVIVAKMALQLRSQNNVIMGAPLVQPNNDLFWFGRPRFVLHLLHMTLFVNAFELAFFVWVIIQFGYNSCHHELKVIIITRTVLAVSVQVLCSYITLPLYALVTQMGSQYKGEILKDQTAHILKQWHAKVRERRKKQEHVTVQAPPAAVSADRGHNHSPSEVTSHNPPTSVPAGANYKSNVSEITEEQPEGS